MDKKNLMKDVLLNLISLIGFCAVFMLYVLEKFAVSPELTNQIASLAASIGMKETEIWNTIFFISILIGLFSLFVYFIIVKILLKMFKSANISSQKIFLDIILSLSAALMVGYLLLLFRINQNFGINEGIFVSFITPLAMVFYTKDGFKSKKEFIIFSSCLFLIAILNFVSSFFV